MNRDRERWSYDLSLIRFAGTCSDLATLIMFTAPARDHTRRVLRAALCALAATLLLAGPAHAALTAVGPTDPTNGFPAWYQDANGTQLTLCIADPKCPASMAAPPFVAPDGENFYQLASAALTAPGGGSVTMDFNFEGAFLGAAPTDQITFGRIQVTMKGMDPNTTYTITYPYGTGQWSTDANGNIVAGARTKQRHEVGCAATPCDFAAALGTEIGPFIQWDPAQSAPPAGYIGDGVTPHTIVGPAVTSVTVTGGSLPAGGISTNLFTVEGKLASPPVPIFFVAPGSGSFGTQRVAATTTRMITVRNDGLAPMPAFTGVAVSGADASSFQATNTTCSGTAVPSGGSCTIPVSFTPASTGPQAATLTLTDADGGTHAVALSGTGAVSGLGADPAVADFPSQRVGSAGPSQTIALKNTGDLPLNVAAAVIDGPNAAEFTVTKNGCTVAVTPGGSCDVAIRFAPTATGTRNASLALTTDAPGRFTAVPLTGDGVAGPAPPVIDLRPRTVIASLSAHHRLSLNRARRGIRVHAVLAAPGTVDLRLQRLGGRPKTVVHTQASRSNAGTLSWRLKAPRLAAGRYRLVATPVIDGALNRAAAVSVAMKIER